MTTSYQKSMDAVIKRYTATHRGLNRIAVEHAVQQLTDDGKILTGASIGAAYIDFLAYMDGMNGAMESGHASPDGAHVASEIARIEGHARIAGVHMTRQRLSIALAEYIDGWRSSYDDK